VREIEADDDGGGVFDARQRGARAGAVDARARRHHMSARRVPWKDWDEWEWVRAGVSGHDVALRDRALRRVEEWRTFQGHVPHAVEVTAQLMEARQMDRGVPGAPGPFVSESMLRLTYAMVRGARAIDDALDLDRFSPRHPDERANIIDRSDPVRAPPPPAPPPPPQALVRMVNGCVDPSQNGKYAAPVMTLAKKIGIPVLLVNVRMEASHQARPMHTFFTRPSVSTFDRVHFQLTGEHFLYGTTLRRCRAWTSCGTAPSSRCSGCSRGTGTRRCVPSVLCERVSPSDRFQHSIAWVPFN
jgi:hypothetical protein